MKELSSNNIFKYATSELSQDAFISWLLSFAMKENELIDNALTSCSRELIKTFYNIKEYEYVTKILKQHKNIDVLVKIGDIHIIIEDKTFTDSHDDQINRYKEALIEEGVSEGNIICVYFKIWNQAKPEPNAVNIFRDTILKVLLPYYDKTDNRLFKDYVDYLLNIEDSTNKYLSEPIQNWQDHYGAYEGFFKKISQEGTIFTPTPGSWNWSHVNNQSGGFMCFWWQPLTIEQCERILYKDNLSEIYLEIENDTIVLKLSKEGIENPDENEIKKYRWQIFDKMTELVGNDLYKKRAFQPGTHMGAGYISYDCENYRERIDLMQKALIKLASEYVYDPKAKEGFVKIES